MNKLRLVQLLESILSKGNFNQQSNEITFYCPFCKHHKKKLNVNLISEKWHCWVCGVGGHKVLGLLKKLKVEKRFFDLLFKITGNRPSKVSTDKNYEILSLPHEFQQLSASSSNNPEARNALSYLKKRGLTTQDILKYNIGYCEKGKYGGMIIIPSYDEEGNLNFFTGRSYYDVNFKHLNPTVSKDIIGFDLFVNWNEPITIVEGAFDAIAVKRNSIPLFGKLILDKLKNKDEVYNWYRVKKIGKILSQNVNDNESLKFTEENFKSINLPSVKILYDMANIYKSFKLFLIIFASKIFFHEILPTCIR